jgi:hypothetical protein
MSAQAPPTERQLRYLRSLASRTATTFATPPTRSQASREIDRLRRLQAAPRERFAQDMSAYATTLHEDEVSGFGAARSWRSRPPGPSAPPKSAGSESRVLARYALSSGQRLIEGIASGQGLTVRDLPASGDGAAYTVESIACEQLERELPALLADYLRRARELDCVPMSREALQTLSGGHCDA